MILARERGAAVGAAMRLPARDRGLKAGGAPLPLPPSLQGATAVSELPIIVSKPPEMNYFIFFTY